MLGDQIYIAGLIGSAAETPMGKTWMLDRTKVTVDLTITDVAFDELQRQIEARMPGKWNRASDLDRKYYIYMRLE